MSPRAEQSRIASATQRHRLHGWMLDPLYIDTAIRRWQGLTGSTARHAANGRSFDDLAREAEAANAV
jgi:hypothetical protein